ncbi:MAG: hypothetical protein WBC15_06625, partial [Mycobacterium sp.]
LSRGRGYAEPGASVVVFVQFGGGFGGGSRGIIGLREDMVCLSDGALLCLSGGGTPCIPHALSMPVIAGCRSMIYSSSTSSGWIASVVCRQ